MNKELEERFIPATMEREIAPNIVYRQIRSWHSNTYAGEKLTTIPGTQDRSGCANLSQILPTCMIPFTVCHRIYWHKKNSKEDVSAFLSYPDAMGYSNGEYFWETLGTRKSDIERFFGKDAEKRMEKKIIKVLTKKYDQSKKHRLGGR